MTYVETFARQQELRASLPERRYITNAEYKAQKSALTRAKNSGDPAKVLAAVEKAVKAWNGAVWPDAWATWRVALEDAANQARRDWQSHTVSTDESDRLIDLHEELMAASYVLFP